MFYSILIFILVTLNGIFHFYILQVSIPCHKLSWQALQLAPLVWWFVKTIKFEGWTRVYWLAGWPMINEASWLEIELPTTFTILSSVLFFIFFCTPFANRFFRKTSHHRSRSFIFSFTCYVSLLAASAYNMLCNWKEDENTKWDTATMNMFPMFIEHEHQHCKLIAN